MKPIMSKHPLATEEIFKFKNGKRVRLYGKHNEFYWVISVRDGKQSLARPGDFTTTKLPF